MKRFLLMSLMVFFAFNAIWAQNNKESKQKFIDAEYFFLNEDFSAAVKIYSELFAADTTNYNLAYRTGACYVNIPLKHSLALPYLLKAKEHVSLKYKEGSYKERNAAPDAVYFLGKVYQLSLDFDKAIENFQFYRNNLKTDDLFYLDLSERDILACERAKDQYAEPRLIEIINLGKGINELFDDFNPCVSKNDSIMFFTRATIEKEKMNNRKEEKGNIADYKIMYSAKRADGQWGMPVDMTSILGTKGTAQTVSLSGDGKTLFLYRDDYYYGTMKDVTKGNIYVSYFRNNNWTPMKKFDVINSPAFEEYACISDDGQTVYFTSDRNGGQGGLDIYQIEKKENGTWSAPQNLGPGINSIEDETAPFIVNDTMLYYCSQGHGTIGGFDAFYSKLNEDGKWSAPINLGVPINSPDNESFLAPVRAGSLAYFSIERPNGVNFGHKDIHKIIIVADKSAKQIASSQSINTASSQLVDTVGLSSVSTDTITNRLTGFLKLEDNNEIEKRVFVKLLEPKTKDLVTQSEINYQTGEFFLRAKPGDYIMQVDADHYESMTQNIFVPAEKMAVIDVQTKLVHKQVASGEYFKIKALFFDFNSIEVNRDAAIELERLLVLMDKNPSLYIEVIGHTDSKGSESFNRKLSLRRSQAVIDYMAKKGIEPSRFVSRGMGEGSFIALNQNADGSDNLDGRKLNRRVEVRILRSDVKNIIVDEIVVPDALKFKDFIRYSILLSKDLTKRDTTVFAQYQAKGLPRILMQESNNQFVYYCGDFKTKADAIANLNKAIDLGFTNAELTDYFKLNRATDITVVKSTNKPHFTIQLMAQFVSCSIAETFKELTDVKEYYCPDGYYRYTFGEYDSREAANKAREKAIERGYTTAFIVNYNRFDSTKLNQTGTLKTQVAEYSLQLLVSKTKADVSTFGLADVSEKQCLDGFYRYYYGSFSSMSAALKAKKELTDKGMKGVFVINKNAF